MASPVSEVHRLLAELETQLNLIELKSPLYGPGAVPTAKGALTNVLEMMHYGLKQIKTLVEPLDPDAHFALHHQDNDCPRCSSDIQMYGRAYYNHQTNIHYDVLTLSVVINHRRLIPLEDPGSPGYARMIKEILPE